MTFDATYDFLLAHPDVSFQPGNYTLQQQMSAEAAIAALQDPANKILNSVTIPEGTAAVDIYALLASALEPAGRGLHGRGRELRRLRRAGRGDEHRGLPVPGDLRLRSGHDGRPGAAAARDRVDHPPRCRGRGAREPVQHGDSPRSSSARPGRTWMTWRRSGGCS